MEKNNDKGQDQGKQSTAETDGTYNLDSEELRKGTTTTMSDAVSGAVAVGGARTRAEGESDTSESGK